MIREITIDFNCFRCGSQTFSVNEETYDIACKNCKIITNNAEIFVLIRQKLKKCWDINVFQGGIIIDVLITEKNMNDCWNLVYLEGFNPNAMYYAIDKQTNQTIFVRNPKMYNKACKDSGEKHHIFKQVFW